MFDKDDEKYLLRVLSRNEVVLFLGAGFSRGAINKAGEEFPTGYRLSEKIWTFLGQKGPYDGTTSLPEMYQAFLNAGIKREIKRDFLERNLLCDSFPSAYDSISAPFWYKIYQLNIDNLIDKIYSRAGKGIQNLIFPRDEFKERDQSLETRKLYIFMGSYHVILRM